MGRKLISTQTVTSSVASVEFTSGISTSYDVYEFDFYDVQFVSSGISLGFTIKTSGSSSFGVANTSRGQSSYHSESGGTGTVGNSGGAFATNSGQGSASYNTIISPPIGSASDESAAGRLTLFQPAGSTFVKSWLVDSYSAYSSCYQYLMGGYFSTTTAVTEIRFAGGYSGPNLASGVFKMYGVG